MTDLSTVALLTQAAELAEKHADELSNFTVLWPRQSGKTTLRHLMRGSGPDHWRAVAAMLRAATERHYQDAPSPTCVCGLAWRAGCGELTTLRPLAELVVRHLGDKTP